MPRKKAQNGYNINGDTTEVVTAKGVFKIDTEDIPKIKQYSWTIDSKGYPTAFGDDKKRIRVYWLIMGVENKEHIDHINQNKLDNRKKNLRIFSHEWQNMGNQKPRKNNTTGYQGVYKTKSGKYIARIGIKRKRINLGVYETPEEAALVRDKKALEELGEFAYLNFPEKIKEEAENV